MFPGALSESRMPLPTCEGIIKKGGSRGDALTLDCPIYTIILLSLDGTFGNLDIPDIGLLRRPAGRRSRPIQHDPLRLSGVMYNLQLLPTPASEIHQLGFARLERMRGFASGREPVELSRLDGLFARLCRRILEDDPGILPGFDDVEPFVFGAVPVWDGRGVMWADGYEVDTSLSKTAWVAEIDLVPLDGMVEGVRVGLRNEGRVGGLDPVCVRTVRGGQLVRWG